MNQVSESIKGGTYVAYVGTYTHGTSIGIHIYDVDIVAGVMKSRKVVPINNPSHLTVSKNGKFLYSIADEGVEAFRILPDGDLEKINGKPIGGIRGCYVDVDNQNRFLFVGGYHDGRVSMMRLREDGGIEGIADGVFHKGMGRNIAERNSKPHVNCVKLTPVKQNYLCAVDGGLDHVKIYKIDYEAGKLTVADILRCPLDSAPRMICFSPDEEYAYVLCELKNTIEIYKYNCTPNGPKFEFIESVSVMDAKDKASGSGASDLEMSDDGKYLFCSIAGKNAATIYEVNDSEGKLTLVCSNDISGDYPKTLGVFPGGQHFASLNHDSDEITIFQMDFEKKQFLMRTKPLYIETPNCIYIHKLR
ncbi:MAG: beta-propeller fold lactonase family protein [Lachnospiraceae bacterium]|jgi:6-phosphogluconolactonase|nr:beta-propeller fold lactonase family protein [Lachnospiraceae bacterium]